MSYFPRRRGSIPVALGLSLTLLADAFVAAPTVAAAAGGADSSEQAEAIASRAVCDAGFGDTASKQDMTLHGVARTQGGAVAVGFSRGTGPNDLGRRRPASVVNRGDGWTRVSTGSPGEEDGLVAVAARGKHTWAVGFTTIGGDVMPLAMRWSGSRWQTLRPPARGKLTSLFTDVTILRDGDPFAVGYRMTGSGRRVPIAAHRDGRDWRYIPVRTGARESVSLTGVASDLSGGLWVVGHGGPGAEVGPVIYRRKGKGWQRHRVPKLRGEAVLADVVASNRRRAWAVGYQREGSRSVPLVLRWNGTAWKRIPAPAFDSPDVQLTAVSAPASGGLWVVGAAWNPELDSHEAVAAWWDGQAWNETNGRAGGTELYDVIGALDGDGWAVGRAGAAARTTRVCIPQAGVFGAPQPAASEEPVPESGVTPDDDNDEFSADADGVLEATGPTTVVAKKKTNTRKAKQRAQAKQKAKARTKVRRKARRAALGGLPVAGIDTSIVARNVTRSAGIFENTGTYDAVIADFDGDGVDDLFIGRHGRKGRLMLNRNGTFEEHAALKMPAIDRHGCTAADVDGSGLPDLYCTIGGKRGAGLKANELWLDPGGPSPVNVAVERGVADPTGRGREAAFLESDGQVDASLIVTNSPVRVDGLPSVGRHYRTASDGGFGVRARPGFAARLGALAVQDADYDGDGREDLLLVTGGAQSPVRTGTHLYRNSKRGLVDVTRNVGIRSIDEVDAELVDLDRDGKLDLVQLAEDKIRVSVLRKGRFKTVWERRLTHGRAVGTGDVNGDGKGDIYIVRSNGARNSPDIMLVNRNGGARWSAVSIPQVYTGSGEDAYAIDYDGNGLDDFVILNGHNDRGPIQLTAFFERQAARAGK